jgi:hypothetical protein
MRNVNRVSALQSPIIPHSAFPIPNFPLG